MWYDAGRLGFARVGSDARDLGIAKAAHGDFHASPMLMGLSALVDYERIRV